MGQKYAPSPPPPLLPCNTKVGSLSSTDCSVVRSYPYFPATIADPTPGTGPNKIPDSVFAARPKAQAAAAEGEKLYLVNFFDKQKTYGWVPHSKVYPLGVDNELDQMYRKSKGKPRFIKQVREAYQ